jgi:DNA repair ATPase RecN
LHLATQLSQQRQGIAPQLTAQISQHLRALGMPNTQVEYTFTALDKPSRDGLDDIELLFSANLGQQFASLWPKLPRVVSCLALPWQYK